MANPGILASKTLAAIEQAIYADQGASYRGHLGRVMPHIGDAYRDEKESFRSHLGASTVGNKCGRAIWYGFRWATKGQFTGRLMRLFNRGHMEEGRFIAMLLTIGVTVYQQDENGKQFRISGAHGHYGGSGDGILVNIPDIPPNEPALGEFKTHNDASFKKLVAEGMRNAKPEHYVQMQQYMRKMGLKWGFYLAVNKNNDELYAEIIQLDIATADVYIDRGEKIVWLDAAPSKIGSPPSPGNYDCKWCDHKPVCHLRAAPARNCRTCQFAMPLPDGNALWGCFHPSYKQADGSPFLLSKEVQETGCPDNYTKHKDMG